MLLPIGDYKGFGMAIVVDMFCAMLSGMAAGDKVSVMYGNSYSERRNLGQFFGAIRIDQFEDPAVFRQRMQSMAEAVRSEPEREAGTPNMVPGDPEKAFRRRRIREGIPVTTLDLDAFREIATTSGLSLPAILSTGDPE